MKEIIGALTKDNLHLHIKIDENGCWNWQKFIDRDGYGRKKHWTGTKWLNAKAHRLVYELLRGPVPQDRNCCHKCDNRRCVNPGHIFIGTQQDNLTDMTNKRELRYSAQFCACGACS